MQLLYSDHVGGADPVPVSDGVRQSAGGHCLAQNPTVKDVRKPFNELPFSVCMGGADPFVWSDYTYIPDTKLKFTEQVPGACFAAVVWSVFSWGFSMYVSYGNGYSIYGSLTIIVIIMLWMYFCMYIILIGAYLNRYFRPVNRVLVNHASSKSELARENRRRIREIKKIQRRKKHYTEIDRDPKEKDENLTDRN